MFLSVPALFCQSFSLKTARSQTLIKGTHLWKQPMLCHIVSDTWTALSLLLELYTSFEKKRKKKKKKKSVDVFDSWALPCLGGISTRESFNPSNPVFWNEAAKMLFSFFFKITNCVTTWNEKKIQEKNAVAVLGCFPPVQSFMFQLTMRLEIRREREDTISRVKKGVNCWQIQCFRTENSTPNMIRASTLGQDEWKKKSHF